MPAPTYPVYSAVTGQPAWTEECGIGGYVFDYPLGERAREAVTITREFVQLRASYVRPAQNARNCPLDANAIFCEDTGFADAGLGLVRWRRAWALLPPQLVDFETYAYPFPGYASTLAAYGRVPFSAQVSSKLVIDFYLVGAGGSHADAGAIPVTFGQTYTYGPYSGEVAAEYLSALSTPTLTAYQALVTADAAASGSYSIEAHDSLLAPWLGNIWMRTRRFVKAR